MNKILMSLHETYTNRLSAEVKEVCNNSIVGRRILERYMENPELALYLTDEENEEYAIAERTFSRIFEKMIAWMFILRPPNILCLTKALLMNTICKHDGAFKAYMGKFTILIGDEASQIPEPALTAISNRLPRIRQIYLGDVHQYEPYVKCPHDLHALVYGARSIMSVLCSAPAVPVASLVRTYMAHPALNEVTNRVAYDNTLLLGFHLCSSRWTVNLLEPRTCRSSTPLRPKHVPN
ncbi:hypothetical protein ANCCAN_06080 [Ancylostoma caninum]|uniref:DNA2/NAM7 helicase helicase domain-containing protein n=1 Tax=Ancylostoma caninum TaxID=29170 RepID=A0A368GU32_ANCCA|nr:hypothetical protein ANCCAN_06080 [Ancylostoma caninum]